MSFDDNNLYGKATGLDERGRYATFRQALTAAYGDLVKERNEFFDFVSDNWNGLFPNLPIRPGRYQDGYIFLYVDNSSLLFAMMPKLSMIRSKLRSLPGAPRRMFVRLEAHSR